MIVGMTYDLRDEYRALGLTEEELAEFDQPRTIEAIETALNAMGFETVRIGHVRSLVTRLARGDRWDMVFNIAEGLRGYGRESLIPALLDAYDIPYTFSDPAVLALTLHKGLTKRVVRDLGIPTPDFTVIEEPEDLDQVDLPFPMFAKPVAEGTGKGITASSRIENRRQMETVCRELLKTFRQPVLVERYLPGREFTVGILGTGKEARVAGIMEVLLAPQAEQGAYSFRNKEQSEDLVTYRRPTDAPALAAGETALQAWRGLGCRDAGRVDLRADERGIPYFLEVNPLAGLHPEHSDLPMVCATAGISFETLIGEIMQSALKRTEGHPTSSFSSNYAAPSSQGNRDRTEGEYRRKPLGAHSCVES